MKTVKRNILNIWFVLWCLAVAIWDYSKHVHTGAVLMLCLAGWVIGCTVETERAHRRRRAAQVERDRAVAAVDAHIAAVRAEFGLPEVKR